MGFNNISQIYMVILNSYFLKYILENIPILCNSVCIYLPLNNKHNFDAFLLSQKDELYTRGLPFSTNAPRGGVGFKSLIHFHCVLHAKRGGGGPGSM